MWKWLTRRLRRPEPHYSVSWEGELQYGGWSYGALDKCSAVMAHKLGRAKADQGLRVTVTRWEGTKPVIEWTNG